MWDPSGQPAYKITLMGPMRNLVAFPIWFPYRHVFRGPLASTLLFLMLLDLKSKAYA